MKKCSKCKIEKKFIEFVKSKRTKNGYYNQCKICVKEYRLNNKEKIKEIAKKYYENNKVKYKEYQIENKDKIKKYQKEYFKEYRLNNKEKVEKFRLNNKEYFKEYNKSRRKNDSLFRFRAYTRTLISQSFKRNKNNNWSKKTKTEIILGCTIEDFRIYIKNKFDKKMNFENYGWWHLDHIIPISIAKTEEDIIKLNHYTNFQPLWAEDNLKKSNKIIDNTQLKLI